MMQLLLGMMMMHLLGIREGGERGGGGGRGERHGGSVQMLKEFFALTIKFVFESLSDDIDGARRVG